MRLFAEPFKCDPGPCPVDDTPHTACTPESVAHQQVRTIGLGTEPQQINVLRAGQKPQAPAAPEPPAPVTFTTKTYNRKKHRRGAR